MSLVESVLLLFSVWIVSGGRGIVGDAFGSCSAADSLRSSLSVPDTLPLPVKDLRGSEAPQTLLFEKRIGTVLIPVLPYLFFDSAGFNIPGRYHLLRRSDETPEFDESRLPSSDSAVCYNILNILGARLRDNPGVKIGIRGCNSYEPERGETEALSMKRARAVSDYLTGIWRVDSNRVLLLPPRNLPEFPSQQRTERGREENRRVEIEVVDSSGQSWTGELPDETKWILFKPVRMQRDVWISSPSFLSFDVDTLLPDSLIVSRDLEIRCEGRLLNVLADRSTTGSRFSLLPMDYAHDWMRCAGTSLSLTLCVRAADGTVFRSPDFIVRIDSTDRTDKDSARNGECLVAGILSGVDSRDIDEIGPVGRRVITDYVAPAATNADRVEILAGRDAVCRGDRSDRLSQSVAGLAKRLFLAHFSSDYPEISATGLGNWKRFGNRDYPERRFYLRSVVFLVRKKG